MAKKLNVYKEGYKWASRVLRARLRAEMTELTDSPEEHDRKWEHYQALKRHFGRYADHEVRGWVRWAAAMTH